MTTRLLVAALLAGALALAGCSEATPTGSSPTAPEPLGVLTGGDPLPEAAFPVLGEPERSFATSELRGRPAIINFWATWCPFCVEEMPDLEAAHRTLGDQVTFVGIDRQDSRERALTLAEETGVTYLLLESPEGDFFGQVKARGMPTTLFVDADGVIQHRHAGPITADELLELVAEKLGVVAGG
jgi:cytochrome c biogenesis protein CcmG/thiol:disulfide interchange protein DsbE